MVRRLSLLRLFPVVLAGAFSLVSCTAADAPMAPLAPTATAAAPVAFDHSGDDQDDDHHPYQTPSLTGLLSCNTQSYASDSRWIGPQGGVLHVGKHLLIVPPGALEQTVLITGEAPRDNFASVRFKPEGLRFAKKAMLRLDYSFCPGARLNVLKRVVYTTDNLDILSYLATSDDLVRMQAMTELEHFSRYAVAW